LTEFEGDLFVGCYLGFLYRPLDPLADADRCSAAKMALTTNLLFAWLMVLTTEEYRTINLIGLTTLPDELKYIADAFETRIGAFVAELGPQRGLPAVMQWLKRNFKSLLCEMRDAYNDFLILEPRRPSNPHRNSDFKSRANFKQRTSACLFSISGTLPSLDSRISSGLEFPRAHNSFQSSNRLRELAVSGVGQLQSTMLPGYMPMSKKFAPSTADVAQPPSAPGLKVSIQDINTNQKRCVSKPNAPALSGAIQPRINGEQFRDGQPLGSGASPLDIGSRNSGDSEIHQVYFHFALSSHQKHPTGSMVPLPSYVSRVRAHWLPPKRSREDDSDPAEGHSAKRRKVECPGMQRGPKPSAAAASGIQRSRAYKLGAILPGKMRVSRKFAAPVDESSTLSATARLSMPRKIVCGPVSSNEVAFGSHQKLPTGSMVPLPSYIFQVRARWLPSKRSREDDSDPADGRNSKRRKVECSGMNEGGRKPSAAAASGIQRIRAYKLGTILPGKMRVSRKFAAPVDESSTLSATARLSMPRKIVSDPVPSNQVAFGAHQGLPAGSMVPSPSYISQVRARWLPSKRSREDGSDPAEGRNAKRRKVEGPGMNEGGLKLSAAAASVVQRIRAYKLGAILPGKMRKSRKLAAPVDDSSTLSATARRLISRRTDRGSKRQAIAKISKLPMVLGSSYAIAVYLPPATSERQPLLPVASSSKGRSVAKRFSSTSDFPSNNLESHRSMGHPSAPSSSRFASSATYTSWASKHLLPARRGGKENRKHAQAN
ncbi:hypothetical protein HWV62_8243, partial [Athelia sp. TMB]